MSRRQRVSTRDGQTRPATLVGDRLTALRQRIGHAHANLLVGSVLLGRCGLPLTLPERLGRREVLDWYHGVLLTATAFGTDRGMTLTEMLDAVLTALEPGDGQAERGAA